MKRLRSHFVGALAATATLAAGAPAAGASTASSDQFPGATALAPYPGTATGGNVIPGPCGNAVAGENQGRTGGNDIEACVGAGLSFIGPTIGQIATVIGPTTISPAVVGGSIVSAGNVAVVP
jgi:hypothetical protein